MSVVDYTSKFCGKVVQSHFRQPLSKEGVSVWEGIFETQTFEFAGLTYNEAHYDGEVTVTDVGSHVYTFEMREKYDDSSSGTAFFAKEECTVSRRRVSPSMWAVTFTRTGGKLMRNGAKYADGPSWMDHYN